MFLPSIILYFNHTIQIHTIVIDKCISGKFLCYDRGKKSVILFYLLIRFASPAISASNLCFYSFSISDVKTFDLFIILVHSFYRITSILYITIYWYIKEEHIKIFMMSYLKSYKLMSFGASFDRISQCGIS